MTAQPDGINLLLRSGVTQSLIMTFQRKSAFSDGFQKVLAFPANTFYTRDQAGINIIKLQANELSFPLR
jgi:hypothetical protein